MKTTIDLPKDLVREIKLRSVMEGRRLKESVADWLRLGMAASAAGNPRGAARKGRIKLPLIQCSSNAPVRRLSNEEIQALTHDTQTQEDLERLGLSV